MKKVSILLFNLLFCLVSNGQEIDLKLNLEKGKEYKINNTTVTNITQEINGQTMNIEIDLKGDMAFQVVDVNNDVYDLSSKFVNIEMVMKMPDMGVEMNSTDPTSPFYSLINPVKDKPFVIKMSSKGKVLEVNNIQEIWDSIFNEIGNMPEDQKAQLKEQIMQSFGTEGIRGNVESVTDMLPEKSVKVGDKWTNNLNINTGVNINQNTEYELLSLDGDVATLKGLGTLNTTEKDKVVETNGVSMTLDFAGSNDADIKLNSKTGWIISGVFNQKFSGISQIQPSPQIPDGMKIPMTMVRKIEVSAN